MPAEIPIIRKIEIPSYCFPVEDAELRRSLSLVEKDLDGLCGIEILSPRRNQEFGFLGRYDPGRSVINLYAQLKRKEIYLLGQHDEIEITSSKLKKIMLYDTIFHEVGHHVGWTRHQDLSEEFADNYAQEIRENKLKWR